MDFSEFFQLIPEEIKIEIKLLNENLKEYAQVESDTLKNINFYTLGSLSGKKIRPTFLMLSNSLFGGKITEAVRQMCIVVELMHTATLVHDDIIDNSDFRRGKESVHKKFGLNSALLCGDYLLTRAFGVCSDLPLYVRKITEKCAIELIEGEIDELYTDYSAPLDDILRIHELKTGSLFALCSKAAAFFCDLNEMELEVAEKFGYLCGGAFQILDDIFDIVGDPVKTGKQIGTDLREKKPSVVTYFWLKSNTKISKMYSNGLVDYDYDALVMDILNSDAISNSLKLLKHKVHEAKNLALILNRNKSMFEHFEKFFLKFTDQPELVRFQSLA